MNKQEIISRLVLLGTHLYDDKTPYQDLFEYARKSQESFGLSLDDFTHIFGKLVEALKPSIGDLYK